MCVTFADSCCKLVCTCYCLICEAVVKFGKSLRKHVTKDEGCSASITFRVAKLVKLEFASLLNSL